MQIGGEWEKPTYAGGFLPHSPPYGEHASYGGATEATVKRHRQRGLNGGYDLPRECRRCSKCVESGSWVGEQIASRICTRCQKWRDKSTEATSTARDSMYRARAWKT